MIPIRKPTAQDVIKTVIAPLQGSQLLTPRFWYPYMNGVEFIEYPGRIFKLKSWHYRKVKKLAKVGVNVSFMYKHQALRGRYSVIGIQYSRKERLLKTILYLLKFKSNGRN